MEDKYTKMKHDICLSAERFTDSIRSVLNDHEIEDIKSLYDRLDAIYQGHLNHDKKSLMNQLSSSREVIVKDLVAHLAMDLAFDQLENSNCKQCPTEK